MRRFYDDLTSVFRLIDASDAQFDTLLLRALFSAEDRRFLYHFGVDPIAIGRAVLHLMFRGRIEGASTIEAQLFRTVSDRREISWKRKLIEALAAALISLRRPKNKIATAYLEVAYFGFEKSGVRFAAAQLGIDPDDLSAIEACELVCRLKRPSRHSSASETNALLRRRIAWLAPKIDPNLRCRLGASKPTDLSTNKTMGN